MSLAVEELYRPVWSAAILDELEFHEARKLVKLGERGTVAARRAARLIGMMRSAFAGAEAQGWQGLEGAYGLPDPDDEHVVAAAVVANAGVIVTQNLKDFPSDRVPSGIQVVDPAEFVFNAVLPDPARGLAAVTA